ncbi:MAG: trypsin-like peptidase domain-containing protein, partial [Desulfomonilaceae bacterium]
MRAFRGFLFNITYFSLCCLFLATISYAENRVDQFLGPNTTGKRLNQIQNEDSKKASNSGALGFKPVPYKPEPAAGRSVPGPGQASGLTAIGYPDIRELIRKVNRCVVSIRMLDSGGSWSLSNLGFSGDSNSRATGYGSGFIISSNGHILTNEHVLRHGTQIEVELLDGSKRLAKVLFKDSKNDIALIKID